MEGEYRLNQAGDAGGGTADLAQESPGFEGDHGLLIQRTDLGVGAVDGLLASGEPHSTAPGRNPNQGGCTLVGRVRPAHDARSGQTVEDTTGAGCADAVDGAGKRR